MYGGERPREPHGPAFGQLAYRLIRWSFEVPAVHIVERKQSTLASTKFSDVAASKGNRNHFMIGNNLFNSQRQQGSYGQRYLLIYG